MVGLSSFPAPQEGIIHEEPNTVVYINNRDMGKGTLYITESVLSWLDSDTQQGLSLEYKNIILHATCEDHQVHPGKCLLVMLDVKVDLPDGPLPPCPDNGSENEDEEGRASMTQMKCIPDNENNVSVMFKALSKGQAIHPEQLESYSDEDSFEDAIEFNVGYYEDDTDGEPYILPNEQIEANHNGTEMDEQMNAETGQFEDAEEDP